MPLREYIYDRNITALKEFIQDGGLSSDIAIYKYAKGDHYIILCINKDLIRFVDAQDCISDLKNEKDLWWAIKNQVEIPLEFGNKKLKRLMIP
jgi:hypothetical protein